MSMIYGVVFMYWKYLGDLCTEYVMLPFKILPAMWQRLVHWSYAIRAWASGMELLSSSHGQDGCELDTDSV